MIGAAPLSVGVLLRRYGAKVLVTWMLLVVEVALLALIPLFLGTTIDALLEQANLTALIDVSALFLALVVFAILRRAYDTRAYGTMRVHLCTALVERAGDKPLSTLNAQVEMGRELVDFLEQHTPVVIAAAIQVVVSVGILFSFGFALGAAGAIAVCAIVLLYAAFHGHFFRLNAQLNSISEQQVGVLQSGGTTAVAKLFSRRRSSEVKLSDADSVLYGLVYIAMFGLILANMWSAAALPGISVGVIFAILSYSWELVEAGVELPAAMQQWTRLAEIQTRINSA